MTSTLPPTDTVFRFSPGAVLSLGRILADQGYPLETCMRAVEAVRFHSELQSGVWYDWRHVFLFGARIHGVDGITLGDRVFLRSPSLLGHRALLAHETMHVVQQRHRRLLPFLARYGWQWLRLRLAGHSGDDAYRALPDEVEARSIEPLADPRLLQIQPWLIPA